MAISKPISHKGLLLNFFLVTLATSTNVFLGLLKLIDLLDIRFYYFYSPRIVNIVIFSTFIDLWIWSVSLLFIVLEIFLMKTLFNLSFPRWAILPILFSLASLAVFLINDRIAYSFAIPSGFILVSLLIYYGNGYLVTSREEASSLTLVCITGLLILFEVASVSTWVLNALDYEVPFGSTLRWQFPWIDLQLFNILYPLTSWLFLFFLYSWIWISALKYILSRVPPLRHILPEIEKSNFSPIQNTDSTHILNKKSMALILLVSLAAVVFITYYPYVHLSSSMLVGGDSVDYYDWLKEMMQKGPYIALEKDRPLFNLLMYSIKYVVASPPETVIRIMPIIFAVCLNLSVYWFVKTGTKNGSIALMSSLFSSFSFQITVGVFAYFMANLLALVETFLLLVFLLKSFEKHSWKYMLISSLIGVTVLLTHPYTWNVLMTILISYFIWILLRKKSEEKSGIMISAFLLAANFLFYALYTLTPFGKGVSSSEAVLNIATLHIGISNLFYLQNNLASLVQNWVGGLFGNPLLIILAVAGMFSMLDFANRFNRMMLLWVMVPSLALLVVSPDPFYYRLIYLIPIQIQAAAGLYWVLNRLEDAKTSFKTSETFRILKISIILLVMLLLLNYSLRSVDEAMIHIL